MLIGNRRRRRWSRPAHFVRLNARVLLALLLVLAALFASGRSNPPVAAHGGGLDSYGCHHNRKAGGYHCHRGPCRDKSFSSKEAMLAHSCSKGK